MRPRLTAITFVIILATAAGIGFGLLLLLQDDDSGLSLNDYFQELAPIINTIDDRSAEQVISDTNQAFAAWAFVVQQTAEDLEAIDPPAEVADPHRELTDAITEVAAGLVRLSSQHPNVETLEEARLVRESDEELRAANVRARDACADLEETADENGVEADLELC